MASDEVNRTAGPWVRSYWGNSSHRCNPGPYAASPRALAVRARRLLSGVGSSLMPGCGTGNCRVDQRQQAGALWEREGVTQTELGKHLAVQPATVTNALRRLERKGLVKRMPDADDQRISRVFLTTEGRQRKANVEKTWDQLEQASFAGFTGRERDLLHGRLSRIHENLAGQQARRTLSTTEPAQLSMKT